MISEPLCLYDCDVPADGSTAVIVSRADAAADLARAPVRIEAVGTALRGRPSWDQFDDLTTMALRDAAAMMWERTDLTPGRRGRRRALRRVQLHHPGLAGGPGLLRPGRGRAVRRRRDADRPGGLRDPTAAWPSTPTAASCPPAGSTASGSSTRPACSCGARRASDSAAVPTAACREVAIAAAGGGPLASSPAPHPLRAAPSPPPLPGPVRTGPRAWSSGPARRRRAGTPIGSCFSMWPTRPM